MAVVLQVFLLRERRLFRTLHSTTGDKVKGCALRVVLEVLLLRVKNVMVLEF